MYLNVQIFLYIIFKFYFVNSFRNSITVNDIYLTTLIKKRSSFITTVYKDHSEFSNMSELSKAAICKNVVKDLRSNEAYVHVHVNYMAMFVHTEKWCTKILVWVSKISGNVEQNACVCFIRSSIIALDISDEYIEYYERSIMIYPRTKQELMIFAYNKDVGNYYVLEILESKYWTKYHPVNKEIIMTVVPQSYGEMSNLQSILNPIFHILRSYSESYYNVVNVTGAYHFSTICQIVFQRKRYTNEIVVTMEDIPKNGEQLIVTLKSGNGQHKFTYMSAYTCIGHIPGTSQVITKFKIAAGPNETTVIVLRESNCLTIPHNFQSNTKCYEIIELIEYLSLQYIIKNSI